PATSTMDPELRSCFEFTWQQNAALYQVNTSLNNSFYRFSLREQEPSPDNNAFAWPGDRPNLLEGAGGQGTADAGTEVDENRR
ncbi:hypothetical protein A2U01_0030529, partial [Trifolium medium]|nr:hypothetical protein [Trifolium medium]